MEELGRALAAALDRGVVELMSLREHWILLLSGVIVPILQDEHSTVMPGACDILSTIGERFPYNLYIVWINLTFQLFLQFDGLTIYLFGIL